MADATPNPLSGQVLLYVDPEPLDPARHGKLGMRRVEHPFAFAARQHFVPLQVAEFGPAALNYPIIFAGEQRSPLAVMGVNAGENLFVSDDGRFRVGAYVPAFIRRYPFVTAQDPQANRSVVCIDRAFASFTEIAPDVRLFEDGKPTTFTQGCIDFCSQFETDGRITASFVKLLGDLDLFDTRQTTFTPRAADGTEGQPQLVAEYFAVSEEKLKALPAVKLAELRDNGALGQIYAHQVSLLGWDRLIVETLERQPLSAPRPANA